MPPSGAPPPTDRLTEGVLEAQADGTLPVGGTTLYRWPWVGALVGAAMMVAGLWVSGSAGQELLRWGDTPVAVAGPIDPDLVGAWVQWDRTGLPCPSTVVVTPSVRYRPVPVSPERVIWVASNDPRPCEDTTTGVIKPPVRAVRDTLDAAMPGVHHQVLWTRSGPSNSAGLVTGGLVFGLLGLFVAIWFSVIGRRVRDVSHPQTPGIRGM